MKEKSKYTKVKGIVCPKCGKQYKSLYRYTKHFLLELLEEEENGRN